jgi:hypothetical protein
MIRQVLGVFFLLFAFNAQAREAIKLLPGGEQQIIQKLLVDLKELRAKHSKTAAPDLRHKVLKRFGVVPLESFREDAKLSAEAALKQDKNSEDYGDHIHSANIILGRLALLDGKVSEAEKYLRQAGKTKGSPTLSSFGPNMMLARDLYRNGSRQAVLDYLDDCLKFWKSDKEDNDGERITAWKASIAKGQEPDFGIHLFN